MMSKRRYVLTDAEVVLELTAQQARVLDYVLRRAQEDRAFFDSLVGSSDPAATRTLRIVLNELVKRVDSTQAA